MRSKKLGILLLSVIMALFCACGKKTAVKDIHTEAQREYLNGAYATFTKYANGTEELSIPKAVELEFKGIKAPYTLVMSEDEDMSGAKSSISDTDTALVYNLKVGTKYYCFAEKDGQKTAVISFETADVAPRNLYIDGVTNARDIGGWKTSSGKKVKQGVVFRTGKFSADITGEKLITEKGLETVRELGIKTEIDLRKSDDDENGCLTESPLGNGVRYVSVPLNSGGNIILLNKDTIKDLFAVFGKEENYPIVFHCSIGTDRTGMLAFLINGLLGVSEDDLCRDFLFSNFGNIGGMRTASIITTYMDTVKRAGILFPSRSRIICFLSEFRRRISRQ